MDRKKYGQKDKQKQQLTKITIINVIQAEKEKKG